MKREIMSQINLKSLEIVEYPVISAICERARRKFMELSDTEVVIYDLNDYIIRQLKWKKQSVYQWLPAILLDCCESMDQDFEYFFENEVINNYRDVVDVLY